MSATIEEPDLDDIGVDAEASGNVSFRGDDQTAEAHHPKKTVLVAPGSLVSLVQLPHPRHSRMCTFALTSDPVQICEVQTTASEFGCWAADDAIEPAGVLHIATPIDPVFLALELLVSKIKPDALTESSDALRLQYSDFETILGDHPLARLSEPWITLVRCSLPRICDGQEIDSNHYFRLNLDKTLDFIQGVVERCSSSSELENVLYGKTQSDVAASPRTPHSQSVEIKEPATEPKLLSQEPKGGLLDARSRAIVLEYVPGPLHALAKKRVDVGQSEADEANNRAQMKLRQRETWEEERARAGAPPEKKRKVETKSVALRRLEKAGPPKGTPSLTAFMQGSKK